VPNELLCVEVTETAVMHHPERSAQLLGELRAAGVAVAIDDFGTGHSSLAYLSGLPASELKIDRSFVLALGDDPAAESIVWAVVNLGLNLGLEVVAEGVESTRAAEILWPMGCKYAQGYLYGRAMAADVFARWYAARNGDTPPPESGATPRLYVDGATAAGGGW
jgi:EAL domain-containing protein (putative c-di-GMP-specific phosphodiesterase class I)